MDLDANWLEFILRKNHFDESPAKVKEIEVKVSGKKGDNYMSNVSKINAKVLLGSGRMKSVALISKDLHTSPHLREMLINGGLFVREITMYRDILPKLEDLMSEFGDNEESLWCQCYDVRLYDRLVLEDLTSNGYSMAKRKEQLNFESASLVLRSLGKFHAMTAVLVERSQIPMDLFDRSFMGRKPDKRLISIIDRTLVNTASTLTEWGDEWHQRGEKLLKGIPDMITHIRTYFTEGYSKGLQVLNHGDCWTNNFLFKWKNESDTPVSMKFVDLQLSNVGNPLSDLLWFFGSSVPIEMRRTHYADFINIYEHSLLTNLQKFEFSGQLPTKGEIAVAMRKNNVILLWLTLMLVPVLMADEEDAWDPEESLKKSKAAEAGEKVEFTKRNLSARQKYVIGSVVEEAIAEKWFNGEI